MYEFLGILFQIGLYFGIIAFIALLVYPINDNIEKYFKNKVVWITGATSDIGRELVKELVRLSPSTRLVLSARHENELNSLIDELKLDPDRYLAIPLDLETHSYGFDSKVEMVLYRFRHIDVLINNDGVSHRSLIKDTAYSADVQLLSINFLGTITLTKTILPHFIKRQKGHFIVVSSVAGYVATPFQSVYAAASHALHGFFYGLRLEHIRDYIDVTIACPHFTRTKMSMNALEGSGHLHSQITPKFELGIDPALCAYEILCGAANRKHEIYIGSVAYVFLYLRRFCPPILYRVLLRMNST